MLFHQVLDDGQPQAQAAMSAGGGSVALAEAFEHVGQEFGADAHAVVADGNFELAVRLAQAHRHGAVPFRELEGVAEQVPDDLLQPVGVGRHDAGLRVEVALDADLARVGGRLHGVDGGLGDRMRRQYLHFQPHLAGGDAAHVEQILDQLGLGAGVALDGLQATLYVGQLAAAPPQHLGPAQDGCQRRAQLVRQGGQELVLEAAGAFGFGAGAAFAVEQDLALLGRALGGRVQAGVVDGDGGLGRDAADDAFGALGKHVRFRMAEVQAAHHFAGTGDDGHGQVAAHEQGGVRRRQHVARIAQQVVAAHRAFAARAQAEQGAGPGPAEVGELGRCAARQGVQHVGRAFAVAAVVVEGAEAGAADAGGRVRHFLQ